MLNQLKLPHDTEYVDIHGAQDAFDAIKTMMVGVSAGGLKHLELGQLM